MNLNTIKDFDFGVGSNQVVRVSNVPQDVSKSEVNLILWLILERRLIEADNEFSKKSVAFADQEDSVDSLPGTSAESSSDSPLTAFEAFRAERQRKRTKSQSARARRHAEDILRASGIQIPFHQLQAEDRKALFEQFSESTELLRNNKFNTISELFEALRKESKLDKNYEVLENIGEGNYGHVFAVQHHVTQKKFAIKKISLTLDNFEEMKMTLNESRILRSLEHENIVRFEDAWLEFQNDVHSDSNRMGCEQEPLKFYVLMEFCYQSLFEWIQLNPVKPNWDQMILILKDTLGAVKYIHSKQILHLDINTRNVMWADEARSVLKLGDFGLSIKGDSFPYSTGSWPYAAPDGVFTSKSDVYSLGVTFLEVAEGIVTTQELATRLINKNYSTEFRCLNNVLPKILVDTPNTRPTVDDLQAMLRRVFNPRVRPVYQIEPEDIRLFSPHNNDDDEDQENRRPPPNNGH